MLSNIVVWLFILSGIAYFISGSILRVYAVKKSFDEQKEIAVKAAMTAAKATKH